MAHAREQLMFIYKAKKPATQGGFEAFLSDAEKQQRTVSRPLPVEKGGSAAQLPSYAGSQACQGCHGGIYRQRAQSGMAKMLGRGSTPPATIRRIVRSATPASCATPEVAASMRPILVFREPGIGCEMCHGPSATHIAAITNGDAHNNKRPLDPPVDFEQLNASAHTHHPLDSEASRCISCHMPRIMDALLFRARSHQIDDIANAEMTLRFGQEDSPNACMLCHTERTAQWVQSKLESWKTRSRIATNISVPARVSASSPTEFPAGGH